MTHKIPQKPISSDDLRKCAQSLDPISKDGQTWNLHRRSMWLALRILKYFLGDEWCQANVVSKASSKSNYVPASPEEEGERYKLVIRVITLAEMIFNLHQVDGFERTIKVLEKNLDAYVAELQAATVVYTTGLPFKFVREIGVKRHDYDLDISLPDGRVAAAEIKCRIEEKNLTRTVVRSKISEARRQLPQREAPEIVFIKLPEAWPTESNAKQIIEGAVEAEFELAPELSAIVFWWEEFVHDESLGWGRLIRMAQKENPSATSDLGPLKGLCEQTYGETDWVYIDRIIASSSDIGVDNSLLRLGRKAQTE